MVLLESGRGSAHKSETFMEAQLLYFTLKYLVFARNWRK